MKNFRKIIAAVLCVAMLLTVCVPVSFAQEEPATDIVQQEPSTETEEEKGYSEKVRASLDEGLLNLERGGLTLASFLVSPLVILFPMTSAVGLILLVKGLPVGIGRVALGLGQIIGSPIIALID